MLHRALGCFRIADTPGSDISEKPNVTTKTARKRWQEIRHTARGMSLLLTPPHCAVQSGTARPLTKAPRFHGWDSVLAISEGARSLHVLDQAEVRQIRRKRRRCSGFDLSDRGA